MHLIYRPAQEEDVDVCLGLLPPAFQCASDIRARLHGLWRGWLRGGVLQMTMIEDESRPPACRRIGFGNSVFVTDEFAAEAVRGLPPHLAACVAQRALTGSSPVLGPAAVRRASVGDGLTLLVLHIGWAEGELSAEEIRRVKYKLIEAFFYTHAGYNVRELLEEVYSEGEMHRTVAAGLVLRNDYAAYYVEHASEAPPEADWPYLLGVTRDEAREGSNVSPLFLYSPPRFAFTPAEQELLQLALIDMTDNEMARALHVSESAVQKRWQTIFERASLPGVRWLPEPLGSSRDRPVRGVEKRRHLISYLRSHPEELRPASAPDLPPDPPDRPDRPVAAQRPD